MMKTVTKTALLASLSPLARAYLQTALWSSSDKSHTAKVAARAAGWSVHGEETPAGSGVMRYVPVGPDENGEDFIHEYEFEEEAWRAAAEESGAVVGDDFLDEYFGIESFSIAALELAIRDCSAFESENAAILGAAVATGEVKCGPEYNEIERAGHDLWLTRNGHGAGFWDGDWPEPYAKELAEAARRAGQRTLYVSDVGEVEMEKG